MSAFLFVAGARPNFMKVAPLLRELTARGAGRSAELVHTGQHYDFEMSGVFLEQLGMPRPDVHLQVGSASHGVQTGRIMIAFDELLAGRETPPLAVIVVGDVNSTMACALVAVKRGIPVAHVEAGLRSFDRAMPEETNRVVTDGVSDLLLVSEPSGLVNLEREGLPADRVRYVGNVMIDSLVQHLPSARGLRMAERLQLPATGYAVVTLHRPSNVDAEDRLTATVDLVGRLSMQVPVAFPVHPRTKKRLQELGLFERIARNGRVAVSPPLGYREFIGLMAGARVVVTDSGGIQEETTHLGVPCVTLRTTTERPVTVTHGTNTLVGDDLEKAADVVTEILQGRRKQPRPIDGWDGAAARRIVDVLIERWT